MQSLTKGRCLSIFVNNSCVELVNVHLSAFQRIRMESCNYSFKKTKTTPPLLTWSTCYAGLLWTLFEGNENSVDPFYLQFCGTGSPTE